MPGLESNLHLTMLCQWQVRVRQWEAGDANPMYGMHWGDPDSVRPLKAVPDAWLLPFVCADQSAMEIGPGGGRWTRYLLGFRDVYAVDFYSEILDELRCHYSTHPNVHFVHNNGTDFPGVPPVDFVFSFGMFVHLDEPVIEKYLKSIKRILRPAGSVVIQYSDKRKPLAARKPDFAEMVPERMRELVTASGFDILAEDTEILPHSSMIRFGHADGGQS